MSEVPPPVILALIPGGARLKCSRCGDLMDVVFTAAGPDGAELTVPPGMVPVLRAQETALTCGECLTTYWMTIRRAETGPLPYACELGPGSVPE